jgi:hypothetical protein
MDETEHVRELVTGELTQEYLRLKAAAGWKLVAVEWVRDTSRKGEAKTREEVPYGLQVSDDCRHLEENTSERQAMLLMLELIVQDTRLSEVAESLNRQGFRTRAGARWNAADVFDLLPRLIEVGAGAFSTKDWANRRVHMFRKAG